MKIQEAIENLKYLISGDCTDTQMDFVEEIEMAIESLEKQIPHKLSPKSSEGWKTPVCGKCNGYMDLLQGDLEYCPNCGQKIDYGDEE